jgi:hypothetical protein
MSIIMVHLFLLKKNSNIKKLHQNTKSVLVLASKWIAYFSK